MRKLIDEMPTAASLGAALRQAGGEFVQRANRAQLLAAKCGRGLFLPLGVALGIGGGMLLLIAVAFGNNPASVVACGLLVLGILAAVWFRPGLLLGLIRTLSGELSNHLQRFGEAVSENRVAEEARLAQLINDWIRDNLAAGRRLDDIAGELSQAGAEMGRRQEETRAEMTEMERREKEALARSDTEKKALGASAGRWLSRLLPGPARRATQRAMAAMEAHGRIAEELGLLRAQLLFLEHARAALSEARERLVKEVLHPLAALRDRTASELQEIESGEREGSRLVTFRPTLDQLRPAITQAIGRRFELICQSLAHRDGQCATTTLEEVVGGIVCSAGVVPQSFGAYLSGCNGDAEAIMERIGSEAKGFSVCERTPGRSPCEFWYCLVAEGANSPAFAPVKGRSQGLPVRGINHTDPCDLIVADLERFVPAAEMVEFVHGARAFEKAARAVQAAIVFVCEQEETILRYAPERAVDPERGKRLLFFCLIWQEIQRTGSEEYRCPQASGRAELIGKGWEAAANRILTDKGLADLLEGRLQRLRHTEGETAAAARLGSALEHAEEFVPSGALSQFRLLVGEELKRLAPAQTAAMK